MQRQTVERDGTVTRFETTRVAATLILAGGLLLSASCSSPNPSADWWISLRDHPPSRCARQTRRSMAEAAFDALADWFGR